MSQIFSFMPDWLLFIIGGIVTIVIYYNLPDELKSSVKKFMRSYGFVIVVGLLWIYYRSQWGIVADNETIGQMKLADFMAIEALLIYFGAKSWLYEQRYFTNHAISNNRQGSVHRIQELGDYVVIFIGGSGASDSNFVIPWPWVQEIWVVPKVACQWFGNQLLVASQLEFVSHMDVDEEISDFIKNDTFGRWHLDNVWTGLWTEQLKASNPKYSELYEVMKKKDNRINELKEMLKGKLTIAKTFISDTMAMTDKIKGKEWRRSGDYNREE